jgi:hypothetical protein
LAFAISPVGVGAGWFLNGTPHHICLLSDDSICASWLTQLTRNIYTYPYAIHWNEVSAHAIRYGYGLVWFLIGFILWALVVFLPLVILLKVVIDIFTALISLKRN